MRSKEEIEAAAKALCRYGDPLNATAYADWDVLSNAERRRLLEAAREALEAADDLQEARG